MLPGILGSLAGQNQTEQIVFVDTNNAASLNGSFDIATATNCSLGPATTGKRVLIAIHWTGGATNRTVSSITVGGVAVDAIIAQDSHTGGSTSVGAAAAIIATTDTTEDIVVTFSGSLTSSGTIRVVTSYTLELPSSNWFDRVEIQGFNDTSVTGTLDVPPGGFLWVVATGSTNTDAFGMTFTGATEDYDSSSSFTGRFGGAHLNNMGGQSAYTIGLTMTDGVGDVDDSGVEVIGVSFLPNRTFFREDWSEHSTGSVLPTGFTQRSSTASVSYAVQTEAIAGSHSGKEFEMVTTADAERWVSFDAAGNTNNANAEVLVRVYNIGNEAATNTSYGGCFLRRSGAAGSETGYIVAFQTDSSGNRTGIVIWSYVAGSFSPIQSISFTWALNTRYFIRLRAYGDQISAKVWASGDAEPAFTTVTDTSVTGAGYTGFYGFDDKADSCWDYISVALNGGTAPLP